MNKNASPWFDHLPVLGNLPPEEAAAKLREVGEVEAAELLKADQEDTSPVFGIRDRIHDLLFQSELKPYQHTAHTLGYIAPAQPGRDLLPIEDIGNIPIPVDDKSSLKNTRVKITLDCLRVAAYPGGGIHHILLHFFAQNQVPGKTGSKKEDVHFNATYRVQQGQYAAIRGYPIFVGLNLSSEGLIFKCRTINVKNERDEDFLGFLRSGVFKEGLHLVSAVQPAIVPLSAMAYGFAEAIADHHRNFSVQDVELGFDFGNNPASIRLAEGAYIAVQMPELSWNWNEWVYNRNSNLIVGEYDQQPIPYNYLMFSISRYKGVSRL